MNTVSALRELHLVHLSDRIHSAQSLGSDIFLLVEIFHCVIDDGQYGGFPDGHAVEMAVDNRHDEENQNRELQEYRQDDPPPTYLHVLLFRKGTSGH
jgi:hypothetical protein